MTSCGEMTDYPNLGFIVVRICFGENSWSIGGFIIRRGRKDNMKGSDKILFLNSELAIILKILRQGRTFLKHPFLPMWERKPICCLCAGIQSVLSNLSHDFESFSFYLQLVSPSLETLFSNYLMYNGSICFKSLKSNSQISLYRTCSLDIFSTYL